MEDAVRDEAVDTEAAASQASSEHSGKKIIRLDNRGLEPPQPMIRTLHALEKLGTAMKSSFIMIEFPSSSLRS